MKPVYRVNCLLWCSFEPGELNSLEEGRISTSIQSDEKKIVFCTVMKVNAIKD